MQYKKKRENIRDKAIIEQDLMKQLSSRSKKQEEKNNGLVIESAWYGDISNYNEDKEYPNAIEVSVPLQIFVEDSKLEYKLKTSKSLMDGFYDPCFGTDKYLWIKYFYNGIEHCTIIPDTSPISLPSKSKYNFSTLEIVF